MNLFMYISGSLSIYLINISDEEKIQQKKLKATLNNITIPGSKISIVVIT